MTRISIKRGKAINNNVAIRKRYENALEQLVLQMRRDTEAEMKRLFRNNREVYAEDAKNDGKISTKAKIAIAALLLKFRLMFADIGKKSAISMIEASNRYTTSAVRFSLEEMTGNKMQNLAVAHMANRGGETRRASLNENESLLKSIPEQYFTGITTETMQAISTGIVSDVEQAVEKQGNISARRAKTIAADQTHKVIQALAIQKMIGQGFKKFEWVYTYRSKEPRKSHVAMNGKVYRFDEPPIVNADQPKQPPRHGYPGTEINCKCVARPVAEME